MKKTKIMNVIAVIVLITLRIDFIKSSDEPNSGDKIHQTTELYSETHTIDNNFITAKHVADLIYSSVSAETENHVTSTVTRVDRTPLLESNSYEESSLPRREMINSDEYYYDIENETDTEFISDELVTFESNTTEKDVVTEETIASPLVEEEPMGIFPYTIKHISTIATHITDTVTTTSTENADSASSTTDETLTTSSHDYNTTSSTTVTSSTTISSSSSAKKDLFYTYSLLPFSDVSTSNISSFPIDPSKIVKKDKAVIQDYYNIPNGFEDDEDYNSSSNSVENDNLTANDFYFYYDYDSYNLSGNTDVLFDNSDNPTSTSTTSSSTTMNTTSTNSTNTTTSTTSTVSTTVTTDTPTDIPDTIISSTTLTSDITTGNYNQTQEKCPESYKNNTCLEHQLKQIRRLTWIDFMIIITFLLISSFTGVYYGFYMPEQLTLKEFLFASNEIKPLPAAISLCSGFITAVEMLGNPAEMYYYGLQFWMICVSFIIAVPLTSHLYLPVFMKLQCTSAYEYFTLRFSNHVRYIASALYIIQMLLYVSVAVFAPALALGYVTGLHRYVTAILVFLTSIFITAQGGLRAIISADTFQMGIIMCSVIVISIIGSAFGGLGEIWTASYKTDRLQLFNMDMSITSRHSFWAILIGGTFHWLTLYASNQISIQKCMAVRSLSQARRALWISSAVLILITTFNFYIGMILVEKYHSCDPVMNGPLTESNQIVPLYVFSIASTVRGSPGLFVIAILAASLGTVSSTINSLAGITFKDFVCDALGFSVLEEKSAFWTKIIVIIYGFICIAMVFVVEQLGSMMELAFTFTGIVGGITLGLFTLGMFFPWANSKGVLAGSAAALVFLSWIGIQNQLSLANGYLVFDKKVVSTDNCDCHDVCKQTVPANDDVFILFRMSYLWYPLIGCVITVTVGLISSYITGANYIQNVDKNLLSPLVQNLLNFSIFARNDPDLQMHELAPNAAQLVGVNNLAMVPDETALSDIAEEDEGEAEIMV